jgi:hypothetical protein
MFLKKYFVFAISLFPVFAFAQVDVLEKLRSKPSYEITLRADSTIEIYNKQQNQRYLRTIKHLPENDNTTQANLIIELDTVNFGAYENLYKRWGSIPATNIWNCKYISVDADNNGKNEIYVWYYTFSSTLGDYNTTRVYEQIQDSNYTVVHEFSGDTLRSFFDFGDITRDGLLDIFCLGAQNNMRFFKQNYINDLIIQDNFNYNPFPPVYQPNNATLYDIDGDGNLEMIYFLFAGEGDSLWAYSNHVAKYNSQMNNFELVYYHRPLPDFYTNGISTGDFDQDGKGNFATGSIYGKFYIYEYVQGNQYQVEFSKELETSNAYLTAFTEDMDVNGKPEIWIGGDFASSVYGGVTRLYAFEATTPGVYEQVYQIDIRGLFSSIDGKMRYVDLDGDGEKELFLTNANLVFCFKYDGNGNYYMDFILQAPRLDSIYTTQSLERIDAADLNGDGIIEIIPQYFLSKGWQESWEYRSVFLKRDKLSDVEDELINIPENFELFQNYPNPFNPETKIKFAIPSTSEVKIKVYNILGKEIKELINETRSSGEYEINWNGTDVIGNKVPSGVYFISMEALNFHKTIKSVLLK